MNIKIIKLEFEYRKAHIYKLINEYREDSKNAGWPEFRGKIENREQNNQTVKKSNRMLLIMHLNIKRLSLFLILNKLLQE